MAFDMTPAEMRALANAVLASPVATEEMRENARVLLRSADVLDPDGAQQ